MEEGGEEGGELVGGGGRGGIGHEEVESLFLFDFVHFKGVFSHSKERKQ